MRRCPECEVDIEGSWHHCPLCRTPVGGKPAPSPFPTIPLSYSRRRLLRVLLLTSIVVIVASFAGQLLLERGPRSFGLLRVIWLGVSGWRARVFPRAAVVLLVIGAVAIPAIGPLSNVLVGTAVLWIGSALLRRR